MKQALLCLVCVTGISVGQLLFRAGALHVKGQGLSALWSASQQPLLWVALVLYCFTTVLWVHVLRTTALSIAYPWMALAFGLVPLMAYFVLKEPIGFYQMVGFILIIIGVILSGCK